MTDTHRVATGALPGTEPIRPYLLSNQFVAWHGLLRVPVDWAPVTHALWIAALYIGVPEYLRAANELRLVLFGVLLVLITLFAPQGLAGLLQAGWRKLRA